MAAIDSLFITISGQPTHEKQKIPFPSGTFNIPVTAFLSSFNATFGFNNNPHTFELEYVPGDDGQTTGFQADTLPAIGSGVAFIPAGDFFIKGRITHADYSKSTRGNILTIRIEDQRECIDDIFIDTNGVFGSNDAPTTGVVDVRYWFIQTRIKTLPGAGTLRSAGRSRAFRDLSLLERQGAPYRYIYEAIKFFEEQVGTITGIIDAIPQPEVIESQLFDAADAFRWKFKGQPLLQALSRILDDVSYDYYWIMKQDRIGVINRKFPIEIDKDEIPIAGDTAPIINQRFGQDEGERPTTIQIFGAEMEGIIGCGPFKEESGAYGFVLPSGGGLEYDLGISVCEAVPAASRELKFVPGWRGATVRYFGPDGSQREFTPSDRQLAAAIKGIEYFAREVNLDNRIDNASINPVTGVTGRRDVRTGGEGRLGVLPNRGQEARSWIMEWYNRTRNFAQNHYSRTYVLSKDAPLYNFIDEIEVLSEAWCNIENLTDDGSYEDNYKISDRFRFLAPFWNIDTNKLKAFATLQNAKWGNDARSTPAQFDSWNETKGGLQLVPIEARKWNRAEDKFKEEFIEPLRTEEKGIMIRLPNLCWQVVRQDTDLKGVNNLVSLRNKFNGETRFDFEDPTAFLVPFSTLSTDIALPIRVKRRYGINFPDVWASGDGTKREVVIREDLAPWNFEPRGVKQSWQLMDDEAKSALASSVVNREAVSFAEASKVGLPVISFDSFANQDKQILPDGSDTPFGLVTHGVTNLGLTKNISDFWQTKYSVRSHFPQLVKARPVFEGPREDFAFVVKRLEEDIKKIAPPDIFQPPEAFDPSTQDGRSIFQSEVLDKLEIPIDISAIFDRGNNEFYSGVDDQGIIWPRALDNSLSLDTQSESFINRRAFAVDGFLQVGMKAVYHYEEQEGGSFVHYFTGGVSLSDSMVVELVARGGSVVRSIKSGGGEITVADIRTLATQVTAPGGGTQNVTPFTLFDVPFLNQASIDSTLSDGTKLTFESHNNKNERAIAPGANLGPNSSTGNFNDGFLINASGGKSDIDFAEVITAPSALSGTGGSIQIVSSTGGEIIADNSTQDDKTFLVRFVGADPEEVLIGDQCIVKQFSESGSSNIRVFCFIVKPKFITSNAFV